ncbi:MAG TPA: YceI family protein [Luteimonas sp.]
MAVKGARTPLWFPLVAFALAALPVHATGIDAAASHVGFQLVARWGEVIEGRFPVLEGELTRLPDGRQQVRLSLSAADVEITDSPRRSQMTRGAGFFDARRHPWITFLSDPFDPGLLERGGPLPGVLGIRDVQRREAFTVVASACARPALECPVRAVGVVDRNAYGMNRWPVVVSRKVRFELSIRVEGGAG